MTDPARPAVVLKDPVLFLAFGFGSGLAPRAPGTFGTLAAVPLLWLALLWLGPWTFIALTVAISALGIWLCGAASRKLGVHDHGGIVWDEFAGLFVTALPVVFGLTAALSLPMALLLAFAWFRLFDVWKPWPIRLLDARVHGGLGIMLDDLLAGVFAAAALVASAALMA